MARATDPALLVAAQTLPPGTSAEWTAMSYQENLVGAQLIYVFGLAIALVYLCLAGQYESWLSPFAVIFSIFFWSIVWGIPGAFIGVPLTIALVTICGHFHETCWITRILAPPPMPEGIKREK